MSEPELIKVVSPVGLILSPCSVERANQLVRKGKAIKYSTFEGPFIQLLDKDKNYKEIECKCTGNREHINIKGKAIYLTAFIKDKKGNILSIGKNSYFKTHPMMVKLARLFGEFSSSKVFIHAEIDAITKCQDLSKAHMIEVYRYSETKRRYVTSNPCKICRTGIEKTPIKYIKYIDNKGEMITERIK